MKKPTNVLFLWHMHQPLYKLPGQKNYYLGWTRLHAVKDYYGMAETVKKFSNIKVVFNFSGVLLSQLLDYAKGKTTDYYAELTMHAPAFMTKKEKDFVVNNFFSVPFERYIRPHKRYNQLHQLKAANKKFTNQDIMDLQVLFNLCWFHPYTVKKDKNLISLIAKERGYNKGDKKYVLDKQYEVITKIIPLYKRLKKDKRIEISITPYYHPILPLIYDTNILEQMPHLKKPATRFSYPQDCYWHLKRAKEIYQDIFDTPPQGSWPSEGSISEDVMRIYHQEKFKWIGLNEGLLFKSLTGEFVPYDLIKNQRHLVYRPYQYSGVNMFFRDRNLSDTISFIYQGWDDSRFAANDFIEHCKRIHYHIENKFSERVITISMDGENAWEYYPNNGVDFLEAMYSGLEKSDTLSTALPGNILQGNSSKPLKKLSAGSWINDDFGVWIGSKENNLNWQTLQRIRSLIEKYKGPVRTRNKIMEYFYIIEGSDWNWWNTFYDHSGAFKQIFCAYAKEIYRLLKKKIPAYLR